MSKVDMKSYREQIIDLRGGQVNEVYFIDTKPNFIYVSNLGTGDLFVSDNMNVTPTKHDIVVGEGMKRSIVKPLGMNKIYIYAQAGGQAKIESGIAELSLSDIPMTQIVATLSNSLSISKVDVDKIIEPLPAGSNLIGQVQITTLPDVNIQTLPTLPTGSNKIGTVSVESMNTVISLLTDCKQLLEDIKSNTTVII